MTDGKTHDTQIRAAIAVHALIANIKNKLAKEILLYSFLQILGVTTFEKVILNQLLTRMEDHDLLAGAHHQLFFQLVMRQP